MSAYAHPLIPTDLPPEYFDQYIGHRLERVCVAFIFLEILVVSLRLYAKRWVTSPQGWDDHLIYPALFANLGACALGIVFLRIAAVGHHLPAVYLQNPDSFMHIYANFLKCTFALQILYFVAVGLPKLSILFLFLRLFRGKTFRRITYFIIFIVAGTVVTSFFAAIFQCNPIVSQWNPTIPGKCYNVSLFYRMSIQNVITDMMMLVLPLPIIWKLNTTQSRKIELTIVFFMGGIGIIAACIRLSVFFGTNAFNDATWTGVRLVAWSIIEPGMYLVAACLPGLRPLIAHATPPSIRTRFFLTSPSKASDLDVEKGAEDRNSFSELVVRGAQSHRSRIYSPSRSASRATRGRSEGDEYVRMPPMTGIEVTNDVLVITMTGPTKPPKALVAE